MGVATQNPVLRERFTGKPEFVVNFFEYVAQEVRELLAQLGFHSLEEAIGRVDALDVAEAVGHWKAAGLDLTPILHQPSYRDVFPDQDPRCTKTQDHGLEKALDNELVALAEAALERGEPVRAAVPVRNVNRTVGTMLGHEVTKRYAGAGLPDDTIDLTMTGSAGQSFGAFVPRGITLRLEGDANDYLGKGLSGGGSSCGPTARRRFKAEEQIIAGNVIAYGATAGRDLPARAGGGAVLRPQLRRDRGGRGCRRPRLRVHDRRSRRGARPHRPQLRGRHVRWLCLRPRSDAGSGQPRARRAPRPYGPSRPRSFTTWRRHHEETGSAVADALLADWPAVVARFTEVMPSDYKRVLDAKAEAFEDGLDEAQAEARIMEVCMADQARRLIAPPTVSKPGDERGCPNLQGVRGRRCAPSSTSGSGRDADHGGGARWLTPRASSTTAARSPSGVRSTSASTTGRRSTGGPGRALLPIIKTQAGRCMDCGIPFCHQGCPLGNIIPEWNDLVWRGDWDGAMDRLHATNNFPEFTGGCARLRARRRACSASTRTAGDDQERRGRDHRPRLGVRLRAAPAAGVASGKTVAVIGSGPAGLRLPSS